MVTQFEDGKAQHRDVYEWKSGSITVAGVTGDTNLNTLTGFTGAALVFGTVKRAHHVEILATATTYIRLNSATADIITVTATTPFKSDNIVVNAIYVTTGGSPSTITVYLA